MSAGKLTTEKKVLLEVLSMLKDHPYLWDKKHPEYGKRKLQNRAYNLLLEKYRTVNEDASLYYMKRKLDSIRLSHKRESKKIAVSKARGEDPCYSPKVWYFDALQFIEHDHSDDTCNSNDQSSDCEDNEEDSSHKPTSPSQTDSNDHNEDEEDDDDDDEEDYEREYKFIQDTEDDRKPSKRSLASTYIDEGNKKPKVEIHVSDVGYTNNVGLASVKVDEAESFGRTVGLQLQQLDGLQRTVAEKLITDVVFFAKLNKLSANSFLNLNSDKYY